jgi:DNA polymerase-3 subunit epsilon
MDKLFFDIESTGLSTETDRIIQLAIKVVKEDGSILVNKSKLYNPEIPISDSAFEAHGISDDDVKDCPLFSEDAKKLKKLFENKIIIGYNIMRFDVPLLMAEFARAKVEVDLSGKFLDVLNIEKKLNSNALAKTYERYSGEILEGAHDAMKDVEATELIFNCQDKIVEDCVEWKDVDLYDLSDTKEMVDLYNKLKRDDKGFLIFNFGKAKGVRVIDDINYAGWILKENFPTQVKDLIRAEQTKHAFKPKESLKITHLPPRNLKEQPKSYNWKPSNEPDDLPF